MELNERASMTSVIFANDSPERAAPVVGGMKASHGVLQLNHTSASCQGQKSVQNQEILLQCRAECGWDPPQRRDRRHHWFSCAGEVGGGRGAVGGVPLYLETWAK